MTKKYFRTFWREPFLSFFCWFFLFFLFSASIYNLIVPSGERNLIGGDYPVFYSAGILARFFREDLYSLQAQVLIQNLFWPEQGGFHVFAYPPFFSLFFIPLTLLSPVVSKAIFVLFLVLLTYFSSGYVKEYLDFKFKRVHIFAFLLLFAPFTIGILGGQNSAISFLLFLLILCTYRSKNPVMLGFLLGVFNFKPQYAFIALLFFIIIEPNKIRMLLSYGLVSMLQLAVSLFYFGSDIIISWISFMSELANLNSSNPENVSRMVSLLSSFKSLQFLEIYLLEKSILVTLIFLIAISAAYFFRNLKQNQLSVTILGPLIVFLSPQTGFYDSVLLLPFFLSHINLKETSEVVWLILLGALLSLLAMLVQFSVQIPVLTVMFLAFTLLSLKSANSYNS